MFYQTEIKYAVVLLTALGVTVGNTSDVSAVETNIRVGDKNLCLAVSGFDAREADRRLVNGMSLSMQHCTNADNQQWELR